MKRHEILGKTLGASPSEYLALLEQEFAAFPQRISPGERNPVAYRESNIAACATLAILDHAGCGPIENLESRLNYGMDWVLEYYFGDWYREEDAERDLGKVPEGWPRRAAVSRDVFWFSLLLGGWTGRWPDVERIAGWYPSHIDLVAHGKLLEPYLDSQFQLVVASSLAPAPIPGVEALVANIKQDGDYRRLHLQLEFELWEAAMPKDQSAFDAALDDRIKVFLKVTKNEHRFLQWADLHASALWLVAERNGLTFPQLRQQYEAAIIRRQTIGLDGRVDPPPPAEKPNANSKRYKILGRDLYEPLKVHLRVLERSIWELPDNIAPGKPGQLDWRLSNVGHYVMLAVLEHLGYGPIQNLTERLNEGMQWVLEFFFGDWDRDQNKAGYQGPVPYEQFPRWALASTGALRDGLILGGLLGRWDDIARIGDWYHAQLDLKSQAAIVGDYIDSSLWFAIASSLGRTPLPGAEALVACVKENTNRDNQGTRLLCAVWEAAMAKDQKAFDKAMKEKMSYFFKKEEDNAPNWTMWISLDTSAVWLIAERNGLAFPKLSLKQDSAVVRRQTVGLA